MGHRLGKPTRSQPWSMQEEGGQQVIIDSACLSVWWGVCCAAVSVRERKSVKWLRCAVYIYICSTYSSATKESNSCCHVRDATGTREPCGQRTEIMRMLLLHNQHASSRDLHAPIHPTCAVHTPLLIGAQLNVNEHAAAELTQHVTPTREHKAKNKKGLGSPLVPHTTHTRHVASLFGRFHGGAFLEQIFARRYFLGGAE